ncbi:MAG: histidine kinase [Candidatus Schekmanbacteria bacterium RBG_16_38_10]|uniref:Histidine kinase n=1 Tax=Candidatus Schekmanbacteria bacterium RBG_16_38_10 TaxID=1817879 RepID=A0A1F7RZS6_9BACT|nr:MAG: histidine kinase [Candidatus Schekmanbacteria bacterium RBG_16_38_10]
MTVKLRLMVIDDEPIVGKRLKQLLEKTGYIVEAFTESSTAVEELEKTHFDIIVTDLKMDGIDGMKILEIARKKNPDTKVIIITGFSKMETAAEAFNKGAFDFIVKPFKIEELKQVIQKAEIELSENKGKIES